MMYPLKLPQEKKAKLLQHDLYTQMFH